MTKACVSMLLFFVIPAGVFCQGPKKDSSKTPPSPPDRNMFGLHTPRGLTKTSDGLADGYVLFAVPNSASFYLVNRKGEVVHEWKGNYGVLGGYLQNDGSLIQTAVDPDFPVFGGGGEAGRIQKISWDSKILWDFEYANEQHLHHHDLTLMPNGHILAIAWEDKSADKVVAAGRKPNMIPKAGLWPDEIIEIEPQGKYGGKVVWEWHIWDHLIQDYDSKKANYGKPANHPELLDFNVGDTVPPLITQDSMDILRAQGRMPWRNQTPENIGSEVYHFNAINYNADLDQIVFSSPNLSEIFIIDHNTTTKEAAGHTGGRWGKGGDFLYRWGNPKNYHHGDSSNQMLFGQHNIRWIEKGKPGEGHLTVFDNNVPGRNGMPFSAIYEFAPPTDKKRAYFIENNGRFGPAKPVWTYTAPDSLSFWASFVSGAQRLNNGNTFINEGPKGRFFEVTKEGKIVWEYSEPYHGDIHEPNGDPIPAMPLVYFEFRATFIPADHPGLSNKKLEPITPQPKIFVMPTGDKN